MVILNTMLLTLPQKMRPKILLRGFYFLKTHYLTPAVTKIVKGSKIHIKERRCHMIWHTYLGELMNERKMNKDD